MINNRNLEDENWKFIEVTKINDKIIKDLVQNLIGGLSDDFYISLESLIRIGKKAKTELKASLDEIEGIYHFKKNIFNILLDDLEGKDVERALLLQLYHTDFTIRANSINNIAQNKNLNYLPFLLPLIEDPDDSVRWTLINSLINLDQIKNHEVKIKLKSRIGREPNQVIKKRIEEVLSNI